MRTTKLRQFAATAPILAVLCGTIALAATTLAGKPDRSGKSVQIPVTFTFRDAPDDGVQSDGASSPVYRSNNEVLAVLTDYPDAPFYLDTDNTSRKNTQNERDLWLDFRRAVGAGSPPFSAGNVDVQLHQTLLVGQSTPHLADMKPDDNFITGLMITFVWNDANYAIAYGDTVFRHDCAGSDPVKVVAGSDLNGDGLADTWTVSATGEAVACLVEYGRKNSTGHQGQFNIPFEFTITVEGLQEPDAQ